MSLTLITAMTSLRVLVGVAGVGYSFFANKDKEGQFDYDEIPKSIFGQAVGGVFYDWLKDGTSAGYGRFLQSLDSLDAGSINHDLQRAARKSTLLATFFACQGCLADIKSERQSIWKRFKNVAWKDEDINWLVAVGKSLKDELKNIETATFDEQIDYKELFSIFDKDNIANSEEAQKKFADKLKVQTLDDIKNGYYSKLGGQITVPFSQNGFELLSEAIYHGWEDFPQDKDFTIQLKLTANGNRVKKYEWFHLVCVIFNEEYKVNEKIEAAMQKQTALEQTALLKQIADFGKLENFGDLERQIADFREENFWYHQITQEKLDEILAILRGQMRIFSQPLQVHNLPPLTEKVYGREEEKVTVLEALQSSGRRFSLVVAPSGFGKTRLLAKVLADFTDGRNVKPEHAAKITRLMLIDCRLVQNLTDITRELNTVLGTQIVFENRLRNYNEAWCKLVFEMIDGETWLFLDNFESWLDASEDYELINIELRSFLNALFSGNHGLHGVILSQSEPESDLLEKLNTLETVGEKLFKGLDKDSAIQFLRENATADNGLKSADESDLVKFLESVSYIPQALNSLIGYLKSKRAYSFADFMRDEVLQTGFDEREQDLSALERGERRTKALIQKQILAQSDEVKKLLGFIAFIVRPVPREALELIVSDKAQDGDSISRLISHNLATRTIDLRGTKYYELHTYFREQSRIVLTKFENGSEFAAIQDLVLNLNEKGLQSWKKNYFNRALAIFECSEKIEEYLVFGKGIKERRNHLANIYGSKGMALWKQGKLAEAVTEYDKSIEILKQFVNDEKNEELNNTLAFSYTNKGLALWNQGKLIEAIDEYNKAIKILKRLVIKEKREELAINLAKAYMNKGLTLRHQGKLSKAIIEYEKSIKINERLVNEDKSKDLAESLAKAYMNKGSTLYSQGKLMEAKDEYDKSIEIRERLVNEENQEEFTNELAMSYWGKGNVLAELDKLNAAVDKYSEAIKLWVKCLQRSELHILPNLFTVLSLRIRSLIMQENWDLAMEDTCWALNLRDDVNEYPDFSEHFKMKIFIECNKIIELIREVSVENREKFYKHAGEDGERVRQLVDDS